MHIYISMSDDVKNGVATGSKPSRMNAYRLLSKLDLPEDSTGAVPCLRMMGRDHLLVENHRGVLEFGSRTVRLYTSIGILKISGEMLSIRLADRESVVCDGKIDCIEFEI